MEKYWVSAEKAEKYARYRLSYSDEAIEYVLAATGASDGTVADIGAGPGFLSKHFLGRVRSVLAIDPDPEMRKVAKQILGCSEGIRVLDGFGEDTGLPDESIDLIVVGNACHRMDFIRARDEFRRILKPGGWLALFSYSFFDEELGMLMSDVKRSFPQLAERIERSRHSEPLSSFFVREVPQTKEFQSGST